MLKKITIFFEQFIQIDEESVDPEHALNLAVAALLIEMVRMDNDVTEEEKIKLHEIWNQHYGITADEIKQLTELAESELNESTDYYQFTALINQNFGREEKVNMIEQLWKIAYSDGKIDSHEEHYLRKVADLLFVPHSEFIKAKLRVID